MKNENNVFGKVTHDNLPQAVEHLIKMMEEQAQNSKNNMSVEDDEISIEEVSSLIKKSVSTIYRYTCQNSIPHSKQGNTLHFYRSEIYNPQIQISAESETKRSIFREKDKTKRSKKESAQHSKSRNKSFVMTSVSAL